MATMHATVTGRTLGDRGLREPPRTVAMGADSATDGPVTTLQSVMRFAFTVAALVGLAALFASQIHATMH